VPLNKNLFFFTSSFPYGNSETFIETEINYLAKSFEKVYIVPESKQGSIREIPSNCSVIEIDSSEEGYAASIVLKKHPLLLFNLYRTELKSNRVFIHDKKKLLSECLRTVYCATKLGNALREYDVQNAIFYSYWMDSYATLLCVLRSMNGIPNLISRAHRFDLYEDKRRENYIPFRTYQLTHVNVVSVISQHGVNYLKGKYPKYSDKIHLDYLGTNDYGINKEEIDELVHVVSVSNVVIVKRVALIVDLLHEFDIPVKWTHFGDGNLMDDLKAKIDMLPDRHSVELVGRKSNQEVLQYLKTNKITCLINVSSSEGLPVSIMEAVSFGIPIVATDVGGTNEIVNDETGMLIDEEFDVKDVATGIQDKYLAKFNNREFRNGIRDYWQRKFSAKANYTKFVKELVSYEF